MNHNIFKMSLKFLGVTQRGFSDLMIKRGFKASIHSVKKWSAGDRNIPKHIKAELENMLDERKENKK